MEKFGDDRIGQVFFLHVSAVFRARDQAGGKGGQPFVTIVSCVSLNFIVDTTRLVIQWKNPFI